MKQNKGYSLVELIMVIAIMGVLLGVGILQLVMVTGFYANECADKLEAELNKVQIVNMARKATEIEIYKDASGPYFVKVIEDKGNPSLERTTVKQVGRGSLLITYSMNEDDSDVKELNGTNKIVLQFNRASGALKSGCHRIWIRQKNGSKVYTITIHKETGKIKVDPKEVKYSASPT